MAWPKITKFATCNETYVMKYFYALLMLLFGITSPGLATTGVPVPDESTQPSHERLLEDLRVYPNPSTTGRFQIRFSTLDLEAKLVIRVRNLIGGTVYEQVLVAHHGLYEGTINLRSVPKGIYMLEVSNGEKKITRRLSFL